MPPRAPLHHLSPVWFSIVMGLCGLALAWQRAVPLMGEMAGGFALVIGALALVVFVALAAAALLRLRRHPQAWAEDRAHPVRHAFMAAMPASLILLSTVAVALFAPTPDGTPLLHAAVDAAWRVGSLAQLAVTLWTLRRWWGGNQPGGLHWPVLTPALFIPVVGNVLAPLAGIPLGFPAWAAAQFGLGLLFWPVVVVLIVVRIAQAGMLPERLLPTLFIFVAPPAVVGLATLQFGAPAALTWMLWGMALAQALWAASLTRRITDQPFGIAHWGMSFPLAALAALSLRLAELPDGRWLQVPALALLALASLVILGLSFATVRGLRAGTLLVPEGPPVIPIQARAGAA